MNWAAVTEGLVNPEDAERPRERVSIPQHLMRSLADFLAPAVCVSCFATLQKVDSSSRPLCTPCALQLPPMTAPRCLRCGATVGMYIPTDHGCVHCQKEGYRFQGAVSLGIYNGAFGSMCRQGKDPSGQPLVELLTRDLAVRNGDLMKSWDLSAIVPVPMHWSNRLFRRVHPNETMSHCLSVQLRVPVQRQCLKMTRKLPPQSQQNPTQRRKNAIGAYRCSRFARLAGKNVLLVDDVMTTGATANACTLALLKQGAAAVYVAVLARGLGHRN